MRRAAAIAEHIIAQGSAAVAETVLEVDQTAVADWPMYDGDIPVDDLLVQRFLSEGFLTIKPDAPSEVLEGIDRRLKEITPPIVRTAEEGEALEKRLINGAERGYFLAKDGASPEGSTKNFDNSKEPVVPELDEMLESPNVKRVLTALLGNNYMCDSDRGSNFTVPGSKAGTGLHRDGNDKRRHHHPRMLMGLYYPQAVTLKMGPTAVIARSQWLSDFDPGYHDHEVVSTPRQSVDGVNMCGDYHATGRGGQNIDPEEIPEYYGETRYMAVEAGTFMIMFYDTWHRATSSVLESDLHLPIEERDLSNTRWMSKFRFWRMEEPTEVRKCLCCAILY